MATLPLSQVKERFIGIRADVLGGPVPAASSSAPRHSRSTANFAGVDLPLSFQYHLDDGQVRASTFLAPPRIGSTANGIDRVKIDLQGDHRSLDPDPNRIEAPWRDPTRLPPLNSDPPPDFRRIRPKNCLDLEARLNLMDRRLDSKFDSLKETLDLLMVRLFGQSLNPSMEKIKGTMNDLDPGALDRGAAIRSSSPPRSDQDLIGEHRQIDDVVSPSVGIEGEDGLESDDSNLESDDGISELSDNNELFDDEVPLPAGIEDGESELGFPWFLQIDSKIQANISESDAQRKHYSVMALGDGDLRRSTAFLKFCTKNGRSIFAYHVLDQMPMWTDDLFYKVIFDPGGSEDRIDFVYNMVEGMAMRELAIV